MKIIKSKNILIHNFSNYKPILTNYKSLKYIRKITYIISTILSALFIQYSSNQKIILSVFSNNLSLNHLGFIDILVFIFIFLLIFFVSLIIYTILHELIHILFTTGGILSDKISIVFGDGAVSVLYEGDETKNRVLLSLISPFMVFNIIIIILYIIDNNILRFISGLLIIMNCASFSDVFMFLFILFKLPKNAKLKQMHWKL